MSYQSDNKTGKSINKTHLSIVGDEYFKIRSYSCVLPKIKGFVPTLKPKKSNILPSPMRLNMAEKSNTSNIKKSRISAKLDAYNYSCPDEKKYSDCDSLGEETASLKEENEFFLNTESRKSIKRLVCDLKSEDKKYKEYEDKEGEVKKLIDYFKIDIDTPIFQNRAKAFTIGNKKFNDDEYTLISGELDDNTFINKKRATSILKALENESIRNSLSGVN